MFLCVAAATATWQWQHHNCHHIVNIVVSFCWGVMLVFRMVGPAFQHGWASIGWGGGEEGSNAALTLAGSLSQDVFCALTKMHFFMPVHNFSVGVSAKKKQAILKHHPGQF
jgi:hypothetical protein